MKHSESGVRKRVSESVYPADILADSALDMCSLPAFGAWMKCLLRMWRDNDFQVTATVPEFARMWRVSEENAKDILQEFKRHNPCTVTKCHSEITLMSRRLERKHKTRVNAANRKKKSRENAPSHSDVTDQKWLSSISSSISSLDYRRFMPVWIKWCEHRRDLKKPFTRRAVEMQLEQLAEWGTDLAIASIKQSIMRGWEGLFEVKPSNASKFSSGRFAPDQPRKKIYMTANGPVEA